MDLNDQQDQIKAVPRPLESHLAGPLQFTYLMTDDGSPTIRFGIGAGASEAMHNLRGAFSETLYIYGQAIEHAFQSGFEPRILSLGLGLGYVEILSVGLALRFANSLPSKSLETSQAPIDENAEISSRFLAKLGGESFELFPELREWFADWATAPAFGSASASVSDSASDSASGSASGSKIDSEAEFTSIYDQILACTSAALEIPATRIKSLLGEMIRTGRWRLRPALESSTEFGAEKFGTICFDAFCAKTSPELWTEDFLKVFLNKTLAARAVLSTYACTSVLKRSLIANGFELKKRRGFAGKRASTFAVRSRE